MALVVNLLIITPLPQIGTGDDPDMSWADRIPVGRSEGDGIPSSVGRDMGVLPGHFTENVGQLGDGAGRFYIAGNPVSVAFGTGWVAYDLRSAASTSCNEGVMYKVTFKGANLVSPEGEDTLDQTTSYLRGNDASQWRRGVRCYERIAYRGLWDGIDLVFHLLDGRLKYDYIVGRGADPHAIVQDYEGVDDVRLDHRSGDLVLTTSLGEVRDRAPVCYQSAPGGREKVTGRYRLPGGTSVGFWIVGHDSDRPLVIDPELDLSTYLGSTVNEYGDAVFIGPSGDVYVTGATSSIDFPTTTGAYDREHAGTFYDVFVAKLSGDGTTLEYSTFIGGAYSDFSEGLYVDDAGRIYIAGYTLSSDFPTTPGAYDREMENPGSYNDLFVLVLDPTGSTLIFSTFIGGSDEDLAFDLKVDASGRSYLVGSTASDNFPTTEGALDRTHNGNRDVFLTRLKADGSGLDVSTLIGGMSTETAYSIELDREGNVLIAGFTYSNDFPTTSGAIKPTKGGSNKDGFFTKLNGDGTSLLYSTFVGGDDDDHLQSVCIDGSGSIFLAGLSSSNDFPTTPDAYDRELDGGSDIIAMKLDPSAANVLYSTYIGGQDFDGWGNAIVGALGTLTLTGYTQSEDFPTLGPDSEPYHGGDADAYILRLTPDGSAIGYSTCIGGGGREMATTLYMDKTGSLCLSGETNSPDFPTTDGAFQTDFGGGGVDVFVCTKWFEPENIREEPVADAGADIKVGQHETVMFDGTASRDNIGVVSWTWAFTYCGETVVLDGSMPSFQFHILGMYTVVLNVTDGDGRWSVDTVSVTVIDITAPVAEAGPDVTVDQHSVVTFDGGASSDENGIEFWWWRFSYAGAPRTLAGFSPSFTFDLVGSYVVQLEVVDPAGNTAVDLMTVVVLDIEDPVADPGPDVTIGQGMDVTLDGSRSRDNVGITSWTWSFTCMGEDHVLEGRVGEYKFDVPGAYPIHLMVHDAAGNSDEATLVVIVLDTMPPSIGPIEDVRASKGETVRFEGTSASDNVGVESWRWSFHDGNRTVVLEGVEAHHVFSIEGNYSITLTVADKAGNTAERSFTVFVQGTPDGKDPVVRPHPYSEGGTTWPVVIILLMLLAIAVAVWVGRRGAKG